jgi:carboxyl-terminal processing protease
MTMQRLTDIGQFDMFFVDVSLKAGVILGIAWALTLVLAWRRRSAAARHMVWALATVSVLLLPMMTATLPDWRIAIPWRRVAPAIVAVQEITNHSSFALTTQVPVEQLALASVGPSQATSAATRVTSKRIDGAAPVPSTQLLPGVTRLPWHLFTWLLGAFLVLAPAGLGLASLWRVGRAARVVTDGSLFVALRTAQEQLGGTQSIRLLQTDERSMPMTWGIWRPTILLPQQANHWSQDRLRIVLLHELAHCQRRDCLTRVLAQMARAIYWFNPIAWLAERQIRVLQEQACDDLVLSLGLDAVDYADQLLAISAGCRSRRWAAGLALAMARTSNLERRLSMILDPNQNRNSLQRRWSSLTAVAAVAVLSIVSVARFEAGAATVEETSQGTQSAPSAAQGADHAQALADLRAKIAEQYFTSVDEKEITQGAIRGMVQALDDPYSDYLTADMLADIEKQLGGTLVGIGAHLEMHEGKIRVVTPLEDSPALKAGIRPGDVILEIDGKPTAGIELPEAVKRIVGPQGSSVRLKLGREGGQDTEMSITRSPIQLQTVKGWQRGADNRWVFLLDPERKIGYAQVAQFGNTTPQELRTAIEALKAQGLKGLILDLRFCPGGTLDSAVAVSKLFLSEGTIVSIHGRNSEPMPIKVDSDGSLGDFPLVLLVNAETSSAAEIVAGALQDNERAIVVGTRSLGKGSVQSLFKLDDGGGAIKLTTSQYRLPKGRNIDRSGAATTWGINPNDGYFVPLDQAQTESLLERRQAREIIGATAGSIEPPPADMTSQWIEQQLADPQLAAALKSLVARLTTGQFEKVSNLSTAEIELALKRNDVERRRAAVLESLDELNQELAALEGEAARN